MNIKNAIKCFILITAILIFSSCSFIKLDKFNDKDEVIELAKRNFDIIELFVNEIKNKFIDEDYVIIENRFLKTSSKIREYNTQLAKELFDVFKLNDIRVDNKNKKILFSVRIKKNSDYPSIYYSYADENYYYKTDISEKYRLISHNNWYAGYDKERNRYGWYTEKITSKLYYYEQYYEGFHCIHYIKDDFEAMEIYPEIYKIYNRYFKQ